MKVNNLLEVVVRKRFEARSNHDDDDKPRDDDEDALNTAESVDEE